MIETVRVDEVGIDEKGFVTFQLDPLDLKEGVSYWFEIIPSIWDVITAELVDLGI